MKTLLEVLKLSTNYLEERGVPSARRQAEDLLSLALGLKRMDLYMSHDRPLGEVELDICRRYLARRGKREPLAYIHGEVEFFGVALHVTPQVLIPRQETEIMAAHCASILEKSCGTLLDLCSGSGCLGISLKKRCPEWTVVLSDLSQDALDVAKKNAVRNEAEVEMCCGDLALPVKNRLFEACVVNPPYISNKDYESLEPEVRSHEPPLALIGGKTGLEFYEKLSIELSCVLKSGAKVWLEIGYDQAKSVGELFSKAPWKGLELHKDWSGKDRFFFLEKE